MKIIDDGAKHTGSDRYPGIFRGTVEYVNDPLSQNRVKVRIPHIHKSNVVTPTAVLPWAPVMNPFGGGSGFGFSAVPPVGSTVFVMFEDGNAGFPVVVGGWSTVDPTPNPMGRANELPTGKISMSPDEKTPWHGKPGVELPEEAQRKGNLAPEQIVLKSPKGHALVMEDRDEAEFIAIVDRAGQSFVMEADVLVSENVDNAARRGLGIADENDQLTQDKLLDKSARIEITDVAGNRVRLFAKKDSEKISIVSRVRGSERLIRMELDAADGTMDLIGESDEGETRIGLDAVTGSAFMRSRTGNELRVDSDGGVSIKSSNISLDGDVHVSGGLSASGGVSSAGSAGGSPGSFNPISMSTPKPPPVVAPDIHLGDVITERFFLNQTLSEQGYAAALAYGIMPATITQPTQTVDVIVARNGVTQLFNPTYPLIVDNLANVFDTTGKFLTHGGYDTLAVNPAFGFSNTDGLNPGSVCKIGVTPSYADHTIGTIGTAGGTTGIPNAVGLALDTKVCRGLGLSVGFLCSAELVCNPDGSVGPGWTIVIRDAGSFGRIASATQTYLQDWMTAHPVTFGSSPQSKNFDIFISPDVDGSFWISLPAVTPDPLPMFNISPIDATLIGMIPVVVAAHTLRALRTLSAPIISQFYTPNLTAIRMVKPLESDEYLDVTYVTTGETIAGRSATAATDVVSVFKFVGDGLNQPLLPNIPAAGTIPVVYLNGLLQEEGSTADYIWSGGRLFSMIPRPYLGDKVTILTILTNQT